jgi:hypothetical protein
MSGVFYLQSSIHETERLLLRLQPAMHRCSACKGHAKRLETTCTDLRRRLELLRNVAEHLLDGGIKAFLQILGQSLLRLASVLDDIAAGRGSHASAMITRALTRVLSRCVRAFPKKPVQVLI